MEKMKKEQFKCIMEDNSEEEREKQWKISGIIFEKFYEHLKNKGLKESTTNKQAGMTGYFIMNYLFIYDDLLNILEVSGNIIRKFLGNWYMRKFFAPRLPEIKSFLKAISDFFTFLNQEGFISEEHLNEIKEVCRDKAWFEMRLETYFESNDENFYKWIQEYNYDWG